jgi:ceramide glucosyltransferase
MILEPDVLTIVIALLSIGASVAYLLFAVTRVKAFGRELRSRAAADRAPGITVLKPICGLDPELERNLSSFCDQDYPDYQVVFGTAHRHDPAIPIIERVIASRPDRDLCLVVDERLVGANPKIANLANMYREAKHEIIAVSDSDMHVGPGYLAALAAAFEHDGVGGVTCLYSGRSVGGLPSDLGAMFINEWFLPSVLVARSVQGLGFCLGATMAVRRDALGSLGGFEALSAYLADDYMLGRLLTERGLEIRLAPYVVENVVQEPDYRSLWLHELRWARTIRSVRPWGFAFSFVTDTIPVSLLSAGLLYGASGSLPGALGVVAVAVAARLWLRRELRTGLGLREAAPAWFVPVRDCWTAGVRAASFLGGNVRWRRREFVVSNGGKIDVNAPAAASAVSALPVERSTES